MDSTQISVLNKALPLSFPFYHLGKVESSINETPVYELDSDQCGILIAFQGDLRGALVFLFDQGLDLSTYTEMGNIIASQTVTRLNQNEGLDVMISAPQNLTISQIQKLLVQFRPELSRIYFHLHKDRIIQLQTLILPFPSEGIGYA